MAARLRDPFRLRLELRSLTETTLPDDRQKTLLKKVFPSIGRYPGGVELKRQPFSS